MKKPATTLELDTEIVRLMLTSPHATVGIRLTEHCLLREMLVTSHPFPNIPTAEEIGCMRRLWVEIERWRAVCGPLKVTSGFRSFAVNQAAGGTESSQHRKGEAADVIPLMGRASAWKHLLALMVAPDWLSIDQAIIYEQKPHIHVSHTLRYPARREILVDLGKGGRMVSWDRYHGPLRETP